MAKKTTLKQMSSDELFQLAEVRKQEEEAMHKEAQRAELDALKAERRETAARHRKEMAAIDARIAKLGGPRRVSKRGRKSANVTEIVLGIVSASKSISTADIKAELDAQGIVANNLSQTLAYLKRQGRISSPSRSVYAPA